MRNLNFFLMGCLLIVTEVTIPFYTSRFNSHLLRIMLISDLEGALESVQLPKFTDEKTSKSLYLVTGKVRLEPNPPNSQCSTSITSRGTSPIVINNN